MQNIGGFDRLEAIEAARRWHRQTTSNDRLGPSKEAAAVMMIARPPIRQKMHVQVHHAAPVQASVILAYPPFVEDSAA